MFVGQKRKSTLRFFVDYKCLKFITVRESNPIPEIDERIDSLGDVKVSIIMDANSR